MEGDPSTGHSVTFHDNLPEYARDTAHTSVSDMPADLTNVEDGELDWPEGATSGGNPTLPGYTFKGWATDDEGTDLWEAPDGTDGTTPSMDGEDMDLYAIWEANKIKLDNMEYTARTDNGVLVWNSGSGQAYSTVTTDGHNVGSDFDYFAGTASGSLSPISTSATAGPLNGVYVKVDNSSGNKIIATGPMGSPVTEETFYIQAKSKLNGELSEEATLKIVNPPKVQSATAKSYDTGDEGTFMVSSTEKALLESITLSDGIKHYDGIGGQDPITDTDYGTITVLGWALGNSAGPAGNGAGSSADSGAIFATATQGQHVWVKLAGDGEKVSSEGIWCDVGVVSLDEKAFTIQVVVDNVSGSVSGINTNVNQSPLGAGVSTNFQTSTGVNSGYVFKGWSWNASVSGNNYLSGTTTVNGTDSNGEVTINAGSTISGSGSFKMPGPAVATTIYAHYVTIPILELEGHNGTASESTSGAPTDPPKVNVENTGKGDATLSKVELESGSYDNDKFDIDTSSGLHQGDTVEAGDDGDIILKPKSALPPGTYVIEVTVEYEQDGDTKTEKKTVTYTVTREAYQLTVTKTTGVASVTVTKTTAANVTTTLDTTGSGPSWTFTGIYSDDTISITSTFENGYTAVTTTTVGATDGGYRSTNTTAYTELTDTGSSGSFRISGNVTVTAHAAGLHVLRQATTTNNVSVSEAAQSTSTTVYAGTVTNVGHADSGSMKYELVASLESGHTTDVGNFTISSPASPATAGAIPDVSNTGSNSHTITVVPTANNLAVGVYKFTLKITEDGCTDHVWEIPITFTVTARTTFDGSVTVKVDGQAVQGSEVYLSGVSGYQTTGADGKASFSNIPNGAHSITINVVDGSTTHATSFPVQGILVQDTTVDDDHAPNVTVEFYTVTAQLGLGTGTPQNPSAVDQKVTLKVGNYKSALANAALGASVTSVAQKGYPVTISAALDSSVTGYIFTQWRTTAGQASTNSSYTFTPVSAGVTYVAYYALNTVTVTFDSNVGTEDTATEGVTATSNPPASMTQNKGTDFDVSGKTPSALPGFKFAGWYENREGTGSEVTELESLQTDKTLYAKWEDDVITFSGGTTLSGEYGKPLNQAITATSAAGATLTFSVDTTGNNGTQNWPGGLNMSSAGVLSGRPFEIVSSARTVTVKAEIVGDTHPAGSKIEKLQDYTITVDKATPTIVSVTVTNATVGEPITNATYVVTVTGPRLVDGGDTLNNITDDQWETYTDIITYVAGTKVNGDAGGIGTVAFSTTATDNKFESSTSITSAFTPGTHLTTQTAHDSSGAFDDYPGNEQSTVWKTTSKTTSHSANNAVVPDDNRMTVGDTTQSTNFTWTYWTSATPHQNARVGYQAGSGDDGYVTRGSTGADSINAKEFTLKNIGNQDTGTLDIEWSSTSGDTSSYFEFTSDWDDSSLPHTSNNTRTFQIKVKDNLSQGVYYDILTITNAAGYSVQVFVICTIDAAATFDAVITVETHSVGGATGSTLPTTPNNMTITVGGVSANLVSSAGDPNNGKYVATGLTAGQLHNVVVGGTGSAPGANYTAGVVSSDQKTLTVKLYEIALDSDPDSSTLTSLSQSGAGWYVENQYANITTDDSVTVSTDTYDFVNWVYDTTATLGGSSANVQVTAAKKYTAKYTLRSAATVKVYYHTNDENYSSGNENSDLFLTQTENVGDNVTVTSAEPTRAGYVFVEWNTQRDGDGNGYGGESGNGTITSIQTDTHLYAKWEPGEVSPPGESNWGDEDGIEVTLKYGDTYVHAVPIPTTTDGSAPDITDSGNLPGGLTFDKNTGVISGRVYQVTNEVTFVITATHHYNGTSTSTYTVKITVGKAQPQLSINSVTNVVNGQAHNTAVYTGTVTAPLLTHKSTGASDPDVWVTKTWNVRWNGTASTGQSVCEQGALSVDSGSFGTGTMQVTLTHTPDTVKTDDNSSVYNTIYENATDQIDANLDNTYTMTVDDAASATWEFKTSDASPKYARVGYATPSVSTGTDGYVTLGTPDTVNAKQFTLKNTGNQAVNGLSYTWGSSGTATSAFFEVSQLKIGSASDTTAWGSAALAAETGTATFTIAPKGSLVAFDSYRDTLTISNQYYSVTVTVIFKVEDPSTYDATVEILLQSVNDYQQSPATDPHADKLPSGVSTETIVLTPIGSGTSATAVTLTSSNYDSGAKKYNATGLVYGVSYTVTVNGYLVPNMVITRLDNAKSVTLYQVTVTDVLDPTGSMTTNSSVSKAYVVAGENATVTIGTAPSGYSFSKLEDTTTAASPVTVAVSPAASYTAAMTHPTAFTAKFVQGVTLTYKPNGANGKASPTDDVTESYTPGDIAEVKDVTDGSMEWTKLGYTFAGWATSESGDVVYAPGAQLPMNESRTLYAKWTKVQSGMGMDRNVTAHYGEPFIDDLTEGTSGGSGDYKYDEPTAGSGTNGGVPDWGSGDGKFDVDEDGNVSGTPEMANQDTLKDSKGASGQKFKPGPFEMDIEITDEETGETVTGHYTVTVEKAKTEVEEEPEANSDKKYYPGDTFDVEDLEGGKVNAKKSDGGTLAEDIPGEWEVVGDGTIVPDENGKAKIKVKFKPYDEGFEEVETEIEIQVTNKEIEAVEINIKFPQNNTPAGTGFDAHSMKKATPTATSPAIADPGDAAVEITDIKWYQGADPVTSSTTFNMTTYDVEVIVTIKTKDNWVFLQSLTGEFYDITVGTNHVTAQVMNVSADGETAILRFLWPKEDKENSAIQVRVTAPTNGANPDYTPLPVGNPAASLDIQYNTTGNTNNVVWIELADQKSLDDVTKNNYTNPSSDGTGTKMTSGNTFTGGKDYVVVVTVKEAAGYKFLWSRMTENDSNEYAQINYTDAKVLSKDNDTVVIAIKLTASSDPLRGITGVSGITLNYYIQTGATTEHYSDAATGNKLGVGFKLEVNSDKFKVTGVNSAGTYYTIGWPNFELWVDTNGTAGIQTTGTPDTKLTLTQKSGGQANEGEFIFANYSGAAGKTVTDAVEGKHGLYVVIPDSTEIQGIEPFYVGELTVGELKAETITLTDTPKLQYTTASATFDARSATAKANVEFNSVINSGVDTMALINTASDLSVGTAPSSVTAVGTGGSDTRPNFYYVVDTDESGTITDTDAKLVDGTTDMTSHAGKDLYACYTDVNGNLVYVLVGKIKISTGFDVTVKDENEGDAEYGDKLTADPGEDGEDDDDDFNFQWQVWVPKDNDPENEDPKTGEGEWKDIPGATGKDYYPKGGDIDKHIRVKATDKSDPDNFAESDSMKIERRSLNFTVDRMDKNYDGDAYNEHEYESDDFHLTGVGNGQGGVMPGDDVSLEPNGDWNDDETTRPSYDDDDVGSDITWPAVSASGSDENASKLGDYKLTGEQSDYYRLVDQDEQEERGTIRDTGAVIHVDVSFKELPSTTAVIPGAPMGVTDERETQPGSGNSFEAKWYTLNTGTTTFDPSTHTGATAVTATDGTNKFAAGTTYAVEVAVKPTTGHRYILNNPDPQNNNTKFYFHFGENTKVEVTKWTTGGVASGAGGLYVNDGIYTMFYVFTVPSIKIAHVNVSVPQPVVDGTPANAAAINKIQVLGTDNSDQSANVTVGTPSWTVESGSSWNSFSTFEANKKYKVEFTLTTGSGYKYLNSSTPTSDATDVTFIVSGTSLITGVNSNGGNAVIDSVATTSTDKDNEYTVTVIYKALSGGKVDLTDVVVSATPTPSTTNGPTGPSTDSTVYGLNTGDGTQNKWQYWNPAANSNNGAWEDVDTDTNTGVDASGNFLPGTHYRVIAEVKLTDTTRYQITTNTKFYLAGNLCTSGNVTPDDNHGTYAHWKTKDGSTATSGVFASDTVFVLEWRFYVPEEVKTVTDITVLYAEPVTGGTPASTYSSLTNSDEVQVDSTTWYAKGTTKPANNTGFANGSNAHTGSFADGTYYMVVATIKPINDYTFACKDSGGVTRVTINGITLEVTNATTSTSPTTMKVKTDSTATGDNEIGWAIAYYDSTSGNIIAKYIAKTADLDKVITFVNTGIDDPVVNGTPATNANTEQALNGSGYVVTQLGLDDNSGKPAATWTGSPATFAQGQTYTVTFTLKTKDGYTFLHNTSDSKYAEFKIEGLTVNPADASGTVKGSNSDSTGLTVEVEELTTTTAKIKITFPETTADKVLGVVTVNYTAPVRDANPAVATDYAPVDQVELDINSATGLKDATSREASNGSSWYKGSVKHTNHGTEVNTTAFDDGDYTVATTFQAQTGFIFNNTTKFVVNGKTYTATADGTDVVVITNNGKTATVYHTFKGLDKTIVKVITSVTPPAAGTTLATTASTPLAANKANINLMTAALDVSTVTWSNSVGSSNTTAAQGTSYTAKYTLTTKSGYTYQGAENYVEFTINGITTPIKVTGANTPASVGSSDLPTGITAIKLEWNGSDTYTVEVTFASTLAKTTLTDVVVEASQATGTSIKIDGPEVDPAKPYELVPNMTNSKWQYWNGNAWTDVVSNQGINNQGVDKDGYFLAGTDYKVTAEVELKSSATSYQITADTKFYLAGLLCSSGDTDDPTGHGTSGKYTQLTMPTSGGTTYQLEQRFSIPSDNVITHVETGIANVPADGGTPDGHPNTTLATTEKGYVVTTTGVSNNGDVNTTWKEDNSSFSGNFQQDKTYSVTYTLKAINGYVFAYDTGDSLKFPTFKIQGLDINTLTAGSPTTTLEGSNSSGSNDNKLEVKVELVDNETVNITITFPKTSADKALDRVMVDYTAPAAGNTAQKANSYSPTPDVTLDMTGLKTAAQRKADGATGSTWYEGEYNATHTSNEDTGSMLNFNGQTFGNGKYTVVTTFKAEAGFKFTNDTEFVVNGTTYTAASNSNNVVIVGNIATVWHTFDGLDKVVVKVTTSVSVPTVGAALQSNANTTVAANKSNVNLYPDALTNNGVSAISWQAGSSAANGNAQYSTTYTATYELTVNTTDGYSYRPGADYVDFTINGTALNVKLGDNSTYTATGTNNETITLTLKSANTYEVKIVFQPTKDNVSNVLNVYVNTVLPPEDGTPVPDVWVISTEPYKATGSNNNLDLHWQIKTGSAGNDSDWTDVAPGTLFQAGKEYRVIGKVTLKDTGNYYRDYDITTNTHFYIGDVEVTQTPATNTSVTVDGVTGNCTTTFAASENDVSGVYPDTTVYTVTLQFPALADKTDKTIVKVNAKVDQPIVGQPINNTATRIQALNKDGIDLLPDGVLAVTNVVWTSSETGTENSYPTPASGDFVGGKYYQAEFDLEANTGYHFLADTASSDYVDFLINNVLDGSGNWVNGETSGTLTDATRGIKLTITRTSNDKYHIKVQFTTPTPATFEPAEPVIWGFVTEPVAYDSITTNAAAIHALAGEPYEMVTNSNKWEKWDSSSSQWVAVTESTFQPGTIYRAQLTVQLTDTTNWKFTTSTPGYINDTTGHNHSSGSADETNCEGTGTHIKYSVTGDPSTDTITLYRVFTVKDKALTYVEVLSPTPTLGNTLPKFVDGVSDDIKWPTGANYTFDAGSAFWTGNTDSDGKAQAGWYTLTVKVIPKAGYELPSSERYYYWKVGAQTQAVAYEISAKGADNSYTVKFRYYLADENAPAPSLEDPGIIVDMPDKGDTPSSLDDSSSYGDVEIDRSKGIQGTTWRKKGSNTTMGPNDKFEAGGTYVGRVYLDKTKPSGEPWTDGEEIQVNNGTGHVHQDENGNWFVEVERPIPSDPPPRVEREPGTNTTTVIEEIVVTYALRDYGVTNDLTAEKVDKNKSPKNVPNVKPLDGLKFLGWSEVDPATLKDGQLPTLVDPTTFKITADKTFYAVYERVAVGHAHYVIGFPDGTFGPDHNITRGQVATIIARACLEGFVEGANYGNPGNYTDVDTHWAASAIAYCSMAGVFTGYEDGTFRPDKYITRQELATVVARLAGVEMNQGLPFSDSGDIANWALNGVYTNYANGWVNGYTDGTFRPLNDITRAETVKIFNGYLGRGTDKEGLKELHAYVHVGVASNNTGNGTDEYMTWPDVAASHWAYYEIIEAANDHNFTWRDNEKAAPPENWYEAFIDEVWRYEDNANDGADDVGRDDRLPVFTVTYVVQSNGVVWDSITEQVTKFSSPKPENLPQAVPAEGYRFVGWSETDPDTGVISIIDPTAYPVLEDRTFYAVFERKLTITYVIGDHGSTDQTVLSEMIDRGESPTVDNLPEITAHEGWEFIGWSETDPATGTVTITDPTDHPAWADTTFYAVYKVAEAAKMPQVTVTYVIGDQGSGSGALTQTFDMYESAKPELLPQVTAEDGWKFLGWSETDPATGDYTLMDPTAISILADKSFYAVYESTEDAEGVEPETPEKPEEPEEPTGQEEPVEYARYHYINGYTDGTFRPDNAFTRAAVATVIANLMGYDPSETYGDVDFSDLYDQAGQKHWATNAISFCVSRGILGGYEDGTFRPDNAISRQEFAVVLTRLSGETESGELPFADVDAIAGWAQESVYTAYAKGWINGYEDGTFLPERNVTRAEAVKMFNSYLGRTANRENIDSQTGYTVWNDVPQTHWAYYEIIEASNDWAE